MDVSAFMTGYFVGLIAGAGVFIWWTYTFGRFLPKEWPFTWQRIARALNGVKPPARSGSNASFSSRRNDEGVTPAE